MLFRKKKKLQEWARKFDKLITGLILGGAVASMIWLSKTDKWKKITQNLTTETKSVTRSGMSFLGKILVGTLRVFDSKNKDK